MIDSDRSRLFVGRLGGPVAILAATLLTACSGEFKLPAPGSPDAAGTDAAVGLTNSATPDRPFNPFLDREETTVSARTVIDKPSRAEIMQALRETYSGTIGTEYKQCTEPTEKRWWKQRHDSIRSNPTFSAEDKINILERLTAAEGLERYVHT